jgi:DNA-directed RNA polymerase subunit alpha
MFQIQCLESTKVKTTELFSKFRIETFAKGQATTVGNALRRTLLSNIVGVAIIGVRISDVNHEFSTIPGVKEDVIEILLNLKQLVFKGKCEENSVARLAFHGPGIVTAENIDLTNDLSFVNTQQYIATVEKNVSLELEFLLSNGRGYSLGDGLSRVTPPGFLAVDAVFMPVRKVNFFVEVSKETKSTDLESLILEIQTDGSITPLTALTNAASILQTLFGSFNPNDPLTSPQVLEEESYIEKQPDINGTLIEELELSVRAYNCLKRANIHTLGDLLKYEKEELLEFKNFGRKSADEVCESLVKRFNVNLT